MAGKGENSLLERVIATIPPELKMTYQKVIRKGSDAHEVMRLYAAMHLWNQGLRQISFEEELDPYNAQGDEEKAYVDIYEATQNLYVECEKYPSKWKLYERARRIKERDRKARFVVAVQDRMGWFSGKLQGVADAVWVVSRSGQVQTWQVWVDERKKILESAIGRYTLKNLLEEYRRAEKEYAKIRELEFCEKLWWQTLLGKAAIQVFNQNIKWTQGLKLEGALSYRTQRAQQELQRIKAEITKQFLAVLNMPLSLSSPYHLSIKDDETITVTVDWDAWQWLSWKDHPNNPEQQEKSYQIMEKTINIELGIITNNLPKDPKHKKGALSIKDIDIEALRKEIKEITALVQQLTFTIQQQNPNYKKIPSFDVKLGFFNIFTQL